MFFEQHQEFFLESHFAVVRLLVFDVLDDLVELGNADTESAILYLPFEKAVLWKCVVDPFGRAALYELQSLGERDRRWQSQKHMNMVWHAADLNSRHLILSRNAAQEWPEPVAQLRRDERSAFFGAEDTMVVRTDVGHVEYSAVPSGLGSTTNSQPQC